MHESLIQQYGGSAGLRDQGLLTSAAFRPRATAFGEECYTTLFEKSAVLGHSIAKNHPFVDGNKRTAFAAMHLMLLINGYDLKSSSAEEIALMESIVAGTMREADIAGWLKEHSGKRK
jgi:death-on-curing protein